MSAPVTEKKRNQTAPKTPTEKRKQTKSAAVSAKRKSTSSPADDIAALAVSPTRPEEIISPLILLKIWLDGWKKSFILHGRSSRFELWIFLLVNTILTTTVQLKCSYILSPRFLRTAAQYNYDIKTIDTYITLAQIGFWLVLILPLFPLGALLIRRMHDINRLAWQNCLEPVFMGAVVISLISIALTEVENTDYAYTALALSICFITLVYSVGFYSLKFLIMTFFYRGDTGQNHYGSAHYNTDAHEEQALNLSCIWFLFTLTIGLLYLIVALI